jgi:hypothetical protein
VTLGGLQSPAAFLDEARALIAALDERDAPAFALRFGAGVIDLLLDDSERGVRAVAARLSLDRAVREHVKVHELEHLAYPRRCAHVQEGEPGVLDLFHGTAYCALCEEAFTREHSRIAFAAGALVLPGEEPEDPEELMLADDVWCHTCGSSRPPLARMSIELPSQDRVLGHFCEPCAELIEELPGA